MDRPSLHNPTTEVKRLCRATSPGKDGSYALQNNYPQRRDRGCIRFRARGISASSIRGDRRASKPGTLIIIPKGTAHGGTIVTSGPVKAIAIKIPPQPKDDVVFIN